ncbi:MAG: hypothetical protein H7A23_08145 [Leptospiraceae bacterium]|nr:hypothetical protein [Leptospiraceae bacterium]MCP5494515.1 hypothetical protein [Leptospiraceae bacterium]
MLKKVLFFILISISLPILSLKNDLIVQDFFNTIINWSGHYIYIKVNETLPRVVVDVEDPDYGKEHTNFNVTEARNKSLRKAKERTLIHIVRTIENLYLDEDYTILKKVHEDESFRERFNQFLLDEPQNLKSKYVNNQVIVESKITFTGKEGLLNYLSVDYGVEEFPEFMKIPKPSSYTGLILDARHLDAKPALLPKIITDHGLEIYSSFLVDKNFAIAHGMASFQKEPKLAMKDSNKVGINPYYVVALNSTGKNNTVFTIPTDDAIKILATEQTRKNLKKCKVIILLKQ